MNKFYSLFYKTLAIAAVLLVSAGTQLKAQLTGTLTVPGNYVSIASAVADINTQGVGSGGVVVEISAGHTETISATISLTVTGTASNPIVFTKVGAGANPQITAYSGGTATPTSATQDGIWRLVGTDYVTIDGIDLLDPNTSNPSTMEYGFALYKASANDGCQFVTIRNCNISLNRINNANSTAPMVEGSVGIFVGNSTPTAATTGLTPTLVSGSNSYNRFYSNTIQNCNYGIALNGFAAATPFTLGDTGNDIGGNSISTGNTILNYGGATGAANPAAGIRANNQWDLNVAYNNINNNNGSGVNHVNTLRGIFTQAGTSANVSVLNNTVTLNGGGTTAAVTAIDNGIGSTAASNTVNILNNVIQNCSYNSGTTGALVLINNSGSAANVNINNNILANNTYTGAATTGLLNGIVNSATAIVTINSNLLNNFIIGGTGICLGISVGSPTGANCSANSNTVTNITRTAASGTQRAIIMTSPTNNMTFNNNVISNISFTNLSSTGSIDGVYGLSSSTNITINNNVISNLFIPTTGTINGIRENGIAGNKIVQGNQISNISTTSGGIGGSTFNGIFLSVGTATISGNSISISGFANTVNGINSNAGPNTISSNTLNLESSSTAATLMNGILISGTGAHSITNNTFNALNLNGIISSAPAISGIAISAGNGANVFGNTITNINVGAASSSGNPTIDGILISGGTLVNIYQNKIHGISSLCNSTTGTINGIRISGGTTNNVYNNLIGGLNFTTSFNPDGVRGISITSTTGSSNQNVYNNSIYLTGTSSGTNFGSSGIFHTTSTTATTSRLDLQNNMIFNLCTPVGAGKVVAFRRSSGAAGALANYAASSNRNLLYVPSTSTANVIYSDGTSDIQTMAAYITSTLTAGTVAPRDAASFTESAFVPAAFFVSTTPSNANYLRPSNGITTQAESGGAIIATFTVDYAGVGRPAAPGTSYDVGAWEFNGVTPAPVISFNSATPTLTPALCVAGDRLISVDATTASGTVTAVTLAYSYNGVAQPTVAMSNGSGNTWSGTIVAPSTPTGNATVSWTVTAVNSLGLSNTFIGNSYSDEPTNGVNIVVNASPNPVCSGATTTLNLSYAANTNTYCTITAPTATTSYFNDFTTSNGIENINNISSGFSSGGLGNFTNLRVSQQIGQSITFNTALVGTTVGVAIWVDWNQNGIFEASERVYNTTGYVSTSSGTITVPSGAKVGNTRMRILMDFNAPNPANPCGPFAGTRGEAEDYTFVVLPAGVNQYSWFDGVTTTTTSVNSFTVNVSSNTTYTSSLLISGCPVSAAVQVSVNPLPIAITFTNGTQCGVGTPTAVVADANGYASPVYNWYSSASGGTLLQTGASNTYTSAINTTTVFYVSVPNPTTTCQSPRTAVTASVIIPDAISAASSNTSVCLGQSFTLTAANTATTQTQNYNYTWQSTAGSGAQTPIVGASTVLTPSATGSFVYNLTGIDGTCTALTNVNVTVNEIPQITSATATPSVICSSTQATLNAQSNIVSSGTIAIGTGTNVTGATTQPTAFCNRWASYRMQTIYTAAELQAAGLTAGNIISIAYRIATLGDASSTTLYTVKCGTTSLNSLTDFVNSAGFTTVFNPATYNHAIGLNTITFNTPYLWDGVSNIVIEVSHNGADAINNAQTFFSTTPSAMLAFSTNGATVGTPSTSRLNIVFGGQISNNITNTLAWQWNPGSINTNTAVVNPTNTGTVASTQVYTATVTNTLTGCSNTSTTSVVVNPIPADPIATNASQCGIGVPTSSVAGSTGYNWYASPTSTTVLQTGASSNFTSSIGATTTWYVSSFDGNCESVNRTAVTSTVSLPDPITATSSSSNLCVGGANTITLTAAPTNTATNYTSYIWTPSSFLGSGMTSTVSGANQIITPDQVGNYTYSVIATDGICTALNTVTVSLNNIPTITASASPTAVCSGSDVNLNATTTGVGSNTISVGNGAVNGSDYDAIFYHLYGGNKTQHLIRASELTAAGMLAGNITQLKIDIVTGGGTYNDLAISIASTTNTAMTGINNTAVFTNVYSNPSYVTTTGINNYNFSTPFNWDGVSNIIVQFCWSNNNGGGTSNYAKIDPTAYVSTAYYRADNLTAAAICGGTTATGTRSNRPRFIFTGQTITAISNGFDWTWNPGSINTNTAVVNPTNTGSVAATEVYTATVTNTLTGCSNTATVGVVVNPLPNAPIANNATQCGVGVPTASVSGGTTYRWYASPTSTTVLQSGTSSNFTTSINNTTTWYVSAFDGTCESPRVALTQTVTSPPLLSVTVPTAAICGDVIETLQITSTVSDYSSYVWSPSTNLYTDASATVPYTGGNASILYYKSSGTSSVNYNIVATNTVLGCVNTATTSASTEVLNIFATVNPTVVCSGSQVNLSAVSGGMGTVAIGTGSLTTSTSGITPYSSNWEGSRQQYLITAAELQAMNLVAGNINSLAFQVTAAGPGTFAQQGFNIKIAHTSNTSIGPGYGTPNGSFITVFGPVAQPAPAVGLNNYNFTTPFNWDGVSNILIDICHDNDVNNTCTDCYSGNSTVRYTTTSFNSVFGSYDDDVASCGVQASLTTSTYNNRPNMILSGLVGGLPAGYTWQWNPGAVNGNTVTVNPTNPGTTSITVIYTVSATNTVSSCANTQTVAVVVNPVPATPIASDATQCGLGIPTASVTSGPILNWFATPSSTVVLQTGSATNFTTPINSTTTWYVSASNGLCSSPRTAVTQTVTPPPALSVTTPTSAVCSDVIQMLGVTSNVSDFDTYVWTPFTNLYSDASATIPYNGTSATAVYFKSSVNGVSNYTVVATNTVGACTNFTTTSVTVDVPQIVTTANPAVVCNGANTTLDARNYIQGSQTLPASYCAASGSGTSACINLVRFGTINRPSNCETGNYIDVPAAQQTTYLSLNRIYTFSVTTSSSAIVSVWIDWNRNGTFETAEWYQPYTTGTNGSAIITVPGTASLGLTKMRVRSRPTGNTNGSGSSCSSLSGEVEDYVVNIVNDQSSAYTWQWNPGAINSNTTSVLASNPGTSPITNSYTVTITNTITACTNSQVLTFTINPTPVVGINPSSSAICIGNSATLTASGSATNFTWSPAGGNASATIVTPTAQATYTLIGEALGCTANATTTINVNALPTVNAIANSTAAICAGASQTLTASGSAINFTWTPSGITSANAVVNPTVTTTYTLTGNDGICSNTANVTVTVTPLPTLNVSASNTIICLGATSEATLTASGTSSTYTWSPIANNTATAVVTPTANATYTVTGEALGCTNTRTIEIAVSTAPSLSVVALGGANICAGNSGTLSAAGSALNFTWTPTGGNGVTAVITPTASTETYTVTGEANGCTTEASITVTVNAIPTVTATAANATICNGENSVLTANTSATTFSWSTGANTASTTVTPTTTTVYTVTVTENGCSESTTVTVNVNACTGIEEQLAKDINLYPNPTTGLLNIVIPEEMVSKSIIEMYDGLGKLVAREELTKTTTKVYMNKLEEGMYFYKIISDTKEMRVGKVIKH